ncbi:MAG TPA: immunoglobulin domain-containing protein, partial [Methylomirabilota bacterium]|nr:immunoglobulin domain-containing protein [Methylomirabilota bacterium]
MNSVSFGTACRWRVEGSVVFLLAVFFVLGCSTARAVEVAPASSVFAWGANGSQQSAVPIGLVTNVVAVAAGLNHSLALKDDGTVVGWGDNSLGQASPPFGLTDVVAIAAGRSHSLALRGNGTVVGWGQNTWGQSAPPAGLQNVVAIDAGEFHSIALRDDGVVIGWGNNQYGQANQASGVVAIAAGAFHNLAIGTDSRVIAWGDNSFGKATPPMLFNVVGISAGVSHSLALLGSGSVAGWGDNAFGKATSPAGLGGVKALAAGGSHSVALKTDGTVVAWGNNNSGQIDVPGNFTNIVAITAGVDHSLALQARRVRITTEPVSRTNVVGTMVSFSVEADGSAPLGYRWRKGTVNLAGATNAMLTLGPLEAADAGNYSVVVSNGLNSVTSTVASLTILVPPTITTAPQSQTVTRGADVNLNVVAAGTAPLAYRWFKDGTVIPTAQASGLLLENVQVSDAGEYSVVVTNVAGSVTSSPPAILTVQVPPVILDPPKAQTVPLGAAVTFAVEAVDALAYQWQKDATNIPNATTALFTLNNTLIQHAGSLRVVVTGESGSITSAPAALTLVSEAGNTSLAGWGQDFHFNGSENVNL